MIRFKGDKDIEKPRPSVRYLELMHFDCAEIRFYIAVEGDSLFTWYRVDSTGKKIGDQQGQFKSSDAAIANAERQFGSDLIGSFVPEREL